jgi:hypothetical protein
MILYTNYTAMIISTNWILTSISSIPMAIGGCFFYVQGLHDDE